MNLSASEASSAWTLGRAIDSPSTALCSAVVRARVPRSGMLTDPDSEALLAQFDVGVLVSPALLPFTGELIPLVERLAEHPRWHLVSVEDSAMVFVEQRLGAGLRSVDKRDVWRQVRREAVGVVAAYPDRQDHVRLWKLRNDISAHRGNGSATPAWARLARRLSSLACRPRCSSPSSTRSVLRARSSQRRLRPSPAPGAPSSCPCRTGGPSRRARRPCR